MSVFNEAGQQLLGLSAEEVKAKEEAEGGDAVADIIRACYERPPLQLELQAQVKSWNGQSRVDCVARFVSPLQTEAEEHQMPGEGLGSVMEECDG